MGPLAGTDELVGLAARAGGPAALICQAVADLYRQYENSIPPSDPARNERGPRDLGGEVVGEEQCKERMNEVARRLDESWPMVARQSRQMAEAPVIDLQIMRRAFAQVTTFTHTRACCLSVHFDLGI
jgi:hypothetical protein